MRLVLSFLAAMAIAAISQPAFAAPEIAVEQPVDTNIVDGGSVWYGGSAIGISSSLTFTIKNLGDADLTGLGIAIDGAGSANYTAVPTTLSDLAAGGSVQVTVNFTPSALGLRAAALHIASNDSDENPFDIALTGLGEGTYPPAFQSLQQAEYFIGTDPGQGNGIALSLTGSNGLACDLAEVTIPVGHLPAGTHEVKVRVRDEAGRWSNPLIRRFTVSSFTIGGGQDPGSSGGGVTFAKTHQALQQAEYFIGTDPGEGNGTPLSLTGSNGLARDLAEVTIPIGQLPAETHEVKVRVRDEAGRWSNPLIRRFTVSTFTIAGGQDPGNPEVGSQFPKAYQPLTVAEWFVGPDPGEGNGTPLAFTGSDGVARDISTVAIPLNMPPGSYDVGLRVKGESGRWSNPLKRRFTLYRQEVLASQRSGSKLVDLEYDLFHGPRNYTTKVLISNDGGLTWTVSTGSVTGDVGTNVTPGREKKIVWHAGEDWNNGFSEDMKFRVIAYETAQDTPSGFAPIVPGSFTMGSPAGEPGRASDETERTVQMNKPFFLKTSEVTWSEWNAVRSQGTAYGYTDIAAGRNGLTGDVSGNHPVTEVSWMDIVKWCNLRSEIEGKKPVYYSDASLNPATVVRTGLPSVSAFRNAGGYRLPSEAEWEFACRAGTSTAFHSGVISDLVADPNLGLAGWYAANSGGNTRLVKGKTANARGLFDMHGNVREWCWDAYGTYASGPQWDPVTGAAGSFRAIRGGDWNDDASLCRSAARTNSGQNSRSTDLGFRIAINYTGLTDLSTPAGIPVDSRDPAAGNLIAGMRPAVNGAIHTALVLPDGKILLGGDFTTVDGVGRNRVARLHADGSLDSAFNPGADSTVYCAAVLPDGKILLGGDFSTVANGPADFIARIHPDGSLDATFHPQVDYIVRCMAAQTDGRTVIGGDFGLVGGFSRNRVARLQPDGALDTGFNPDADGSVRTLAIQTDGRILLGGIFGTVGGTAREHLARVHADGTLDSGFSTGANGEIRCLAVQSNGQIVVGGAFGTLGGQVRSGLGRLSNSGILDSFFDPAPNGPVNTLATQADGRLLIGGEFTTIGGSDRRRLACLDGTGVLQTQFALDFNGPIHTLNLLPSGRLIVGGTFGAVSGVTRQGLAWLDNDSANGTLAAMSGSRVRWLRGGASPETSEVAFEISTDGGTTWLPLGNGFRISGGWERTGVNLPAQGLLRGSARIPAGLGNGSGALVSTVTSFSGLVTIPEIAVESPTGSDVADGESSGFGVVTMGASRSRTFVIRNLGYGDLTGLTVTKSGSHPTDFIVTLAPVAPVLGPAGSTALVVTFTPGDIGERSATLQIANNDANENPYDISLTGAGVVAGQPADDIDPAVSNRVNAIAIQPDGKVLIGGTFTNVGGQPRGRFARLNADLTLEPTTTFATGSGITSGTVFAAAVQPDGMLLIAGQFASVNANARGRIARLRPDGSLEPTGTFNPAAITSGTIHALAVQPDGKILIAGEFTSVGGQSRPRIARLNSDGTLDTGFLPGTGASATVHCLALQSDGRILIGGNFTTFNGVSRLRLARLLPDGGLDESFQPAADAKVSSLALQPDGKLLIGGLFTTIAEQPCPGVARLTGDGTAEGPSSFDPGTGPNGEVMSIVLQADGRILLAGAFTIFNGEDRAGIARLYSNGTLESGITFDTLFGSNSTVAALALRSDGSVIAGGDFTDYNGLSRGRLTRLANQPATDQLVVTDASRIEWNRGGTAPEVGSVSFELSTDSGTTWQALAPTVRKPGGWELTGLSLPSSGHIRARGRSAFGLGSASSGLVEKIEAFVNPPVLATLPASGISMESAVLNGSIIPHGSALVKFEYGASTDYGSFTAPQAVSGNNLVGISELLGPVSGLYHFRIVAETSGGTYYGADEVFVTLPVPPVAVTANPVSVTSTSATLMGAVNPKGRETTVHFEYGATTLYGNTTPPQILAAGNNAIEVIAPVTGLSANATYHYRIVAVSSGGTAFGSNVTFQATSGGTPTAVPSVTTGGATEITTAAASLGGTVNPNGGFTNAFFEYGTTDSLGSVSPNLGAGNGAVPAAISWTLPGLDSGTPYHYRLVASNSLGTTHGAVQTFRTLFPPPLATTLGAAPLTTTSARVQGTARARNASTEVFCDFGTDGLTFPNSINTTPPLISGDEETAVTADLINLQGGVTYHYRIRAVSSGGTAAGDVMSFTPTVLSGLTQVFPGTPPDATGQLTVTLNPAGIASGWRFRGERQWRSSGSTAGALATGDRDVEFRPVAGHIQPPGETVSIISGSAPATLERDYYETETAGSGSLTVILKPDEISASSVPLPDRAQWRFLGDDETLWRESGTALTGLAPGNYLIECKAVAGRATPPTSSVTVSDGQNAVHTVTYFLADAPSGTAPEVLAFSAVSGDITKPYAYVGQIRSDAGLSSGFVVKPRVVATAAHVAWDDGTLSAVTGLQWLFQRDKGTYEPTPQVPRGFYIFDGYAAQRTADNSPGNSSPQSQTLDVASLYFVEDAGRGGYGGFLASDLTANEFLLSSAQKTLVGYPVDGIPAIDQGRMHATAPANVPFSTAFGRTFTTGDIRSSGGMSGGPLCIQHSNGNYYPAAIYLGGTNQTVVRAIDSGVIDLFNRADVSGNGGDNNTGGGITHSSFSSIGTSSQPGALEVTIQPAAARNAGAGWRLKPETSYRPSNSQKTGLNPGNYILQLNTVSGFQVPTQQSVTVNGGQLREITFTYAESNAAPSISNVANQTIDEDTNTGSLAITLNDVDDAETALILTGFSSNTTLVPNANIDFSGSGANRTVTVTPAVNQSGSATITLSVSDGALTDTDTFLLTVNAINDAPTLTIISDQQVATNTATAALPITIGDIETSAASLTLTGSSTNATLVPEANILFAGSGTNRTVTITPASGQLGSATITLTVGDGSLTSKRTFLLTVSGTALETWRFANFGSANDSGASADLNDKDGDGANNRDEYAADTNPNNASDVFRILTTAKTGGGFTVTAPGKTSRTYVLERRGNLSTGEWTTVDSIGPLAADGPVNLTDPAPPSNSGFYRMRVSAP